VKQGHRPQAGTGIRDRPDLDATAGRPPSHRKRTDRRFVCSPRGGRWQIVIMYCVCGSVRRLNSGITGDTLLSMAMTLRLADDETEALRRRAELEQRSMQEVARQAIREYVENHSRAELLDQVLDGELPRYAEALERLGQ
jgi:hypothetical protein